MHQPAYDRLIWLRSIQNPDGGWGYHEGTQSWLEPTLYALMAFLAWDAPEEDVLHAWSYACGLQRADGSWKASRNVDESHWSGSLCMNIALRRGPPGELFARGLHWLLGARGSEGRLTARLGRLLDPSAVEYDPTLCGWPWTAGTNSWIEPTCHALIALARAREIADSPYVRSRLDQGRKLLLDRRCRDGGWNYGNRRVRGYDLPGYPETTALALLALTACGEPNMEGMITRAKSFYNEPGASNLARAWLSIALRAAGHPVELEETRRGTGIMTAALETIAWSGRGFP
ncbi:MAG: terpene cyclase/mutase family protein [Acidobacteriota bacterium]|nr:terpene cyclase/mutase family protein [Acidobacteriota bacterium]